MGIKTTIRNGTGTDTELTVDANHSAYTTDTGVPPESINTTLKPFAKFMVDSTGDNDMRVSGTTTTPIDFAIESSSEGDRFIHTICFTIADAGASFNEFGNTGSPLTNGCQLIYQDKDLGDVILEAALTTNFDFVQLCNFEPTFGTGADAFKASNVSGASEAYVPVLDVEDVFGMKYGLRLPKNSSKKLILRIQDNTTGVDRFDVKVYGFDRINHD